MNESPFAALLRRTGETQDRRTSLRAVAAAASAALVSPAAAAARKGRKNQGAKRRKRRQRVQQQCRAAIAQFCVDAGGSVAVCLNTFRPCCATSHVKTAVLCVLEVASG